MLLDFFCIFSTGGLILWFKQFVSCKYETLINYFIKTILLDQKRTIDSLSVDGTVLRWKISDESNLIFLVAYQEAYSLLYVDKLVTLVMNQFLSNELSNVTKSNDLYYDNYDYTKKFMEILSNWESSCNKILEGGEESKNVKDLFKKPKSEQKKKVNSAQDKNNEKDTESSVPKGQSDQKENKDSINVKKISNFNSNIPKNLQMKKISSQDNTKSEMTTSTTNKKVVKEKTLRKGIGEYSEQDAKRLNM